MRMAHASVIVLPVERRWRGALRAATSAGTAPPPFAPGEVQKLLDGYAVIQAQEFLGLSDEQFGQFLPRLRALQEVRRRNEQERVRLLRSCGG